MDKYRQCLEDFFDLGRMMETAQEVARHPKPLVYGLLLAVVVAWVVVSSLKKLRKPTIKRASTPDLEKPATQTQSKFKAPERPPGGMEVGHLERMSVANEEISVGSNRF